MTSVRCIATCVIVDPEAVRFQQIKEISKLYITSLFRESYIPIFMFKYTYVGENHVHSHHLTAILTGSSVISSLVRHFRIFHVTHPCKFLIAWSFMDMTANGNSVFQCWCFFQIWTPPIPLLFSCFIRTISLSKFAWRNTF